MAESILAVVLRECVIFPERTGDRFATRRRRSLPPLYFLCFPLSERAPPSHGGVKKDSRWTYPAADEVSELLYASVLTAPA